jgi:hypothetical protein
MKRTREKLVCHKKVIISPEQAAARRRSLAYLPALRQLIGMPACSVL